MHVDEPRVAPWLVAPHPNEQVVAGEDAVGLAREGAKQLELGGRERKLAVARDRLKAGEIDDEPAEAKLALLRMNGPRAVAAHERFDPSGELVVVKRLAEVVIGTDAQTHDAVRRVVLGREEEHRNVGIPPQLKTEADAIDARHEHVQGHQIGLEFAEGRHRLPRIGDRLDLVPGLGKHRRHELGDVPVVVDDEDPPAGDSLPCGWRGFLIKHVTKGAAFAVPFVTESGWLSA